MPFIPSEKSRPGLHIGLWHITESPEELEEMYGRGQVFLSPKNTRFSHWYASRLCLERLLPENVSVEKDAYGKPYVPGLDVGISITHAGEYAAAITSEGRPCGIDIERISDRIHHISHKFMNEWDYESREHGPEAHSEHLIWGAKECLFKYYGLKEVDFREHLFIEPFRFEQEGVIRGFMKKPGVNIETELEYRCFGDYLLVYTI